MPDAANAAVVPAGATAVVEEARSTTTALRRAPPRVDVKSPSKSAVAPSTVVGSQFSLSSPPLCNACRRRVCSIIVVVWVE